MFVSAETREGEMSGGEEVLSITGNTSRASVNRYHGNHL